MYLESRIPCGSNKPISPWRKWLECLSYLPRHHDSVTHQGITTSQPHMGIRAWSAFHCLKSSLEISLNLFSNSLFWIWLSTQLYIFLYTAWYYWELVTSMVSLLKMPNGQLCIQENNMSKILLWPVVHMLARAYPTRIILAKVKLCQLYKQTICNGCHPSINLLYFLGKHISLNALSGFCCGRLWY